MHSAASASARPSWLRVPAGLEPTCRQKGAQTVDSVKRALLTQAGGL